MLGVGSVGQLAVSEYSTSVSFAGVLAAGDAALGASLSVFVLATAPIASQDADTGGIVGSSWTAVGALQSEPPELTLDAGPVAGVVAGLQADSVLVQSGAGAAASTLADLLSTGATVLSTVRAVVTGDGSPASAGATVDGRARTSDVVVVLAAVQSSPASLVAQPSVFVSAAGALVSQNTGLSVSMVPRLAAVAEWVAGEAVLSGEGHSTISAHANFGSSPAIFSPALETEDAGTQFWVIFY